jgi:hypothetical protein
MSEPPVAKAFKQSATIAAGIGASLGLVADVLNPLAPFAWILLWVSLAGLVVCCLIGFKKGWGRVATGTVFTLISTILMGGLVVMQMTVKSKLGFLAEVIPAVKTLQEKLPLPELPPLPKPPEGVPAPPPLPGGAPGKPPGTPADDSGTEAPKGPKLPPLPGGGPPGLR